MTDYISREAFLEHIRKDPLFDLVERYGLTNVIEVFPAADVVEVVHGDWEIHAYGIDGEDVYCSVCGKGSNLPYWNYCPRCGAKMDGGDRP